MTPLQFSLNFDALSVSDEIKAAVKTDMEAMMAKAKTDWPIEHALFAQLMDINASMALCADRLTAVMATNPVLMQNRSPNMLRASMVLFSGSFDDLVRASHMFLPNITKASIDIGRRHGLIQSEVKEANAAPKAAA